MKLALIAPELRWPTRLISAMPMPIKSALGRRIIRKLIGLATSPKQDEVAVEELSGTEPRIRLYRPTIRKCSGAFLWIHGGGFVIGQPSQNDPLLIHVAARLGLTIASVAYRLAPDHPFPAPLDDCFAAWNWLQRSAAMLDIDPNRIAIGGESAGGGLAASLVQRIHDEGIVKPVAQWLLYPMLDDRTAAKRELDAVDHFLWNNDLNAFGWRSFLGQAPGALDVPQYASPSRRRDLAGLPPTWIGVGSADLFYEEDLMYAGRLLQAGAEVDLQAVSGAPHGFISWAFGSTPARALVADGCAWLDKKLV